MNRKGNVPDLIYILVILFSLGITIIIAANFYSQYTDSISLNPAFDNPTNTNIEASAETMLASWDYLFIFIFIGLIISTIVLGFRIRTHPVFFFISLILLIVVTILAGSLSNVYEQFTTNTTTSIQTTASSYTAMNFLFAHLPLFIAFLGVVIMVIFYSKDKFMEDME
tara:strand:+ start:2101 stop:2604 length:504 start_codon:yes stop_codon:yes gene_type:complete